jgi:hypothetical protein
LGKKKKIKKRTILKSTYTHTHDFYFFILRLAILKLNGEELLGTKDDGAFLDILKRYFTTLDNPINDDKSGRGTRLTVS